MTGAPPAGPDPVVVRPAATVVVVRDRTDPIGRSGTDGAPRPVRSAGGAGSLEVLLLRRRHDSGFVPGAHVFPGGGVDPEDAEATDPTWAERAAAILEVDDPHLAAAHWAAGLRETFEECGALLARDGRRALLDPSADPGLRARLAEHRAAVDAGRRRFGEVLATEALTPALDALRYLGRWITPVGAPRRYDTRFFVAVAPDGQDLGPDGRETTELRWERPADALELHAAGELLLILPTLRTVELLADFRCAADLLAALPEDPAGHVQVDDGGWRVPLRGETTGSSTAPWPAPPALEPALGSTIGSAAAAGAPTAGAPTGGGA